jgi:hypothetical protein
MAAAGHPRPDKVERTLPAREAGMYRRDVIVEAAAIG